MTRQRLLLHAGTILLYCATGTYAWGKVGHEIVGNLAWALLSPPTQYKISTILNQTATNKDCAEYCSPLAAVADWADRARYSAAYQWTAPLHYVDVRDDTIPGGCPAGRNTTTTTQDVCRFVYARDCVDDICVAGAIVNYTSNLRRFAVGGGRAPVTNQSRESLMFLVHFVGDCHQPLHVARNTDRGGNSIMVKFLNQTTTKNASRDRNVVPTTEQRHLRRGHSHHTNQHQQQLHQPQHHHALNLHAIWDDSIIETTMLQDYNNSRNAMELNLLNFIWNTRSTSPSKWNNRWLRCADGGRVACTTEWAQESWTYAVQYAYRNEDGREIVSGTALTRDYYVTRLPVVREQLAVAAVRLASTLELTFGFKELGSVAEEST